MSKLDLPRTSPGRAHSGPSVRYAVLLSAVFLLLLTGVVLVLSATSATGIDSSDRPLQYFTRHLWSVGIAVAVLLVTLGVDYRRWRRMALPLAAASVSLLVIVLAVGQRTGGARRWIEIGQFSVQPSEIAKLALIVALAAFLDARKDQIERPDRILRPAMLLLTAGCSLVLLQPDLGTTLILAGIGVGMLFVAGLPGRDLAKIAAMVAVAAPLLAYAAPYRRARLAGFLDPIAERSESGYQTFQSLVGLAQGGLRGTGLGAGQAKWGWVPNAPTDFIFVIVGEEMGLLGALGLLTLLGVVGIGGLRTSQKAPDLFGSLLAAGIAIWFVLQTLVNVGGVVGLLPVTGVTLPFLSFGGSSLVVTAAAAGLLLNVTRRSG
ncbi:putative lipid II flippase FtsW [Candidatus Poriferisodalis sp.]|uniref:putative lipid II flippase FtsW n=1 Tax=Candidatus Poriferisodalis sp. TaxID=3101277 RepID=UPI003B58F707